MYAVSVISTSNVTTRSDVVVAAADAREDAVRKPMTACSAGTKLRLGRSTMTAAVEGT